MKKKKIDTKIWLVGILSMLFLAFAIPMLSQKNPTNGIDTFKWHGLMCPEVERADGSIEKMDCWHNTVTNAGKDHIEYHLGTGMGSGAFDYLAIGNGSAVAAASTTLDGEKDECGLTRQQGTYVSDAVNGNWSIQYQWTSSCDSKNVNTTALFNATSAGTMLAGGTFSSAVTLNNGDKLNVTYHTWVS